MNASTMKKFFLSLLILATGTSMIHARTTLTASQPYGLRGEVVQGSAFFLRLRGGRGGNSLSNTTPPK